MTDKHSRAPATAPYFFQVYGHADLRCSWSGWRIRGAWLISPDGERINARRLAGILLVERLRARVVKAPVGQGMGPAARVEQFRARARRALADAAT